MSKTTAQIDKQIALITKAGAKLDAFIQGTAVDVLEHYSEHSDTKLVNRLYLGMPKGARKAALTEWLLKFGKVQANTGDDKKTVPFLFDKTRTTNLDGAIESPWYDFKPDPVPDVSFDYYAMLMAVMAKGEKAASKGVEVKGLEFAQRIKAQLEEEMAAVEQAEKAGA